MKVLGPRVVIKRLDAPKLKSSLIEIVENDPKPSQYGLVLFVGNGRHLSDGTRQPIPITPGDVVILKDYSGTPVKVMLNKKEVEAFVVMEDDCLATVEL